MSYVIKRTNVVPKFDLSWDGDVWSKADIVELNEYREESQGHRPVVKAKVLHDARNLYGMFRVEDKYVIAVQEGFQAPVCLDSCVEFFFKPSVGKGYFNLEISASAAYLMTYIRDHRRTEDGFEDYTKMSAAHGALVKVKTSLQPRVYPEIAEPLTWYAQFQVPMEALEPYCGMIPSLDGVTWKGNFFKCADECSHPHWLTWKPLTALNYHLPECFGTLELQ